MHIEPNADFHQVAGTVAQFHNALLSKGFNESTALELTKEFLHTMIVQGHQQQKGKGDNE